MSVRQRPEALVMKNIVRLIVPLVGLAACACSGSPTSHYPLAPSTLGTPMPGLIPSIVESEPATELPRAGRGVCGVETDSAEPVSTTMPVRDGDQPCGGSVRVTLD